MTSRREGEHQRDPSQGTDERDSVTSLEGGEQGSGTPPEADRPQAGASRGDAEQEPVREDAAQEPVREDAAQASAGGEDERASSREAAEEPAPGRQRDRPRVKPRGESVLEGTRALLDAYLARGALTDPQVRRLEELSGTPLAQALPDAPSDRLTGELFLIRAALHGLRLLVGGRGEEAAQLLLEALLTAEAASARAAGRTPLAAPQTPPPPTAPTTPTAPPTATGPAVPREPGQAPGGAPGGSSGAGRREPADEDLTDPFDGLLYRLAAQLHQALGRDDLAATLETRADRAWQRSEMEGQHIGRPLEGLLDEAGELLDSDLPPGDEPTDYDLSADDPPDSDVSDDKPRERELSDDEPRDGELPNDEARDGEPRGSEPPDGETRDDEPPDVEN